MNRIQSALAITALVTSALPAHATVSVGAMSRQDGSNYIEDSLHHRQWLGWDVTRGLNDTQTLAAIEEGVAQLDRGEGRPWEQVREEFRSTYLGK